MELELRQVTLLAVVLRILAAVICGGAIGIERELKNRPAGLRTYMLVCVGSCLIMLTNQYIFQVTQSGDPMRLGAQVVSGIGFLGAGTIIVTRHNQIKGLTTAAGLWSSAGVGLALGIGFYEAALVAGVFVFVILTLMQRWDDRMHTKTRVVEVYVELDATLSLGEFIRTLRDMDLEIQSLQIEKENALEAGTRGMLATLRSPKRCNHRVLIEQIKTIKGVSYLEEL